MNSPQELRTIISSGLLSFPLTDFDAQLRSAPKPFAERLERLMPYGAAALFDQLGRMISKLGPQ